MTANIVVDTCVWSAFLRRSGARSADPHVSILRSHLEQQDCLHLPGIVLQEILSGIKTTKQFQLLQEYFEPFPLITLTRSDYIAAATLKNSCLRKGIQAGAIDFLIAAICIQREYMLLTADRDFAHIAKHSKLQLVKVKPAP
jgi:predicted nucleic acid-binding protein